MSDHIQPPRVSLAGDGDYAALGVPSSRAKLTGVPEIAGDKVARLIEVRGVRLGWARSAECPCRFSNESDQPDPSHTLCNGTGRRLFRPAGYAPPVQAGELTPLQEQLLGDYNAAVIRGVMSTTSGHFAPNTSLGEWSRGVMFLSVRAENRIGFYDTFINLDTRLVHTEAIDLDVVTDDVGGTPLRYRALEINKILTLSGELEYGIDYVRSDLGRITWLGTRPSGRIGVHYTMHPVWRAISHPHALRASTKTRKELDPLTPVGNPQELALQAEVLLDFLPEAQNLADRSL